ncbi:MAG: hypothetical protein NE330_07285 [Lentisphaeraceae bacterium]|nr:hypothetical protein [Lentisphaeraceae bacterium]
MRLTIILIFFLIVNFSWALSIDHGAMRHEEAEKIIIESENYLLRGEADKIDNESLEKFVRVVTESEWMKADYWFFKNVLLKSRALVCLGREDDAENEIYRYSKKLKEAEEKFSRDYKNNNLILESEKLQLIKSRSFTPGRFYALGMVRLTRAIKGYKSNSLDIARDNLIGKTGAAVKFYLCVDRNRNSPEAYLSIRRFELCQQLSDKWFSKKLKTLKVTKLELGKSYFVNQDYEEALIPLKTYLSEPISQDSFSAILLLVKSLNKLKSFGTIDDILAFLDSHYMSFSDDSKKIIERAYYSVSNTFKNMMEGEMDFKKKEFFRKKQMKYYPYKSDKNRQSFEELSESFEVISQRAKDGIFTLFHWERAVYAYSHWCMVETESEYTIESFKCLAKIYLKLKDFDSALFFNQKYLKTQDTKKDQGLLNKLDAQFFILEVYLQSEDNVEAKKYLDELKVSFSNDSLKSIERNQKFIQLKESLKQAEEKLTEKK